MRSHDISLASLDTLFEELRGLSSSLLFHIINRSWPLVLSLHEFLVSLQSLNVLDKVHEILLLILWHLAQLIEVKLRTIYSQVCSASAVAVAFEFLQTLILLQRRVGSCELFISQEVASIFLLSLLLGIDSVSKLIYLIWQCHVLFVQSSEIFFLACIDQANLFGVDLLLVLLELVVMHLTTQLTDHLGVLKQLPFKPSQILMLRTIHLLKLHHLLFLRVNLELGVIELRVSVLSYLHLFPVHNMLYDPF